jgi:hypothetical protein
MFSIEIFYDSYAIELKRTFDNWLKTMPANTNVINAEFAVHDDVFYVFVVYVILPSIRKV